jgi:succinyl-CoA synthetase beta subunit
MFLLEYEGKKIFREGGVTVPESFVIKRGEEPRVPEGFEFPLVVKGQYLAGGRGKAGAVRIVRSHEEFVEAVGSVFDLKLGGKYPDYILVEKFVPHTKELYLSILVSKPDKGYVLLASREGGVEVEELAKREGALLKLYIDPLVGIQPFHLRIVSKFLLDNFNKSLMGLVKNLYSLVVERDLLLAEINPLVVLDDGSVVALDSKVIIDDNSEIRQELSGFYEYMSILTEGERLSKEYGFSYVPLHGEIGVMGNGAGLTMATLDLVDYYGGSPACFVDVGGGASEERIRAALDVMIREIKPRAIFINIFAGITRCDDVARAVVSVVNKLGLDIGRMVIRLTGTNEDIGEEILKEAGFKVFKDMDDAAKEVVRICS